MASRTETALKDVPDSDLMPSLDDDDAAPAQEPAAEAPQEPQEAAPEPTSDPEPTEAPAAEAAPEVEPAQPEPEPATVPSYRLKEESDRRREAESNFASLQQQFGQLQGQLAALQGQINPQPQPEPIDPYEDPTGYQAQQNQQVLDAVNERLYQQSKAFADQTHGADVVNEAFNWALNTLPKAQQDAISGSVDPFGECVRLKKDAELRAEFGTDPAAYREKVLNEALKDPDYLAKVQGAIQAQAQGNANPGTPNIKLPPSLSGAPAAADAKADAGDGQLPMSDAELFNDAMAFNPYK